ncbi:di-heme-cytochrome C peroxidase [Methylobacterium sp. J-078]|uniref:di-heme-cytochrome C peroxidase n=1 Tax=Methylobacterium sp. J-078 TaxID=2836657 RepID=UPI001FBABA6F|nr:di-heme-cytochrome C peroxidase [Methylobacterium sp. J-078]MCJ2045238.1 di-heme-cytochrome C peroxidase [Methylobacterium sp. J-078]
MPSRLVRAGRRAALGVVVLLPLLPDTVPAQSQPQPVLVDQGANWAGAEKRRAFYSQDQGSQLMPLTWLQALRKPDGAPFLADSLSRYGYLPNPDSPTGLPVGFTAAGSPGGEFAGMTCAACHTRQIDVGGTAYRIDGGPAIVDFQSFLADLDKAVGGVVASPEAFAPFARSVLGAEASEPNTVRALFVAVDNWYYRYHTLISRALPAKPWGPARLDAVGMIFNRLTGLDIGTPPNTVIPENIHVADAPARYPFLWNAPIQDKTQWPGFADNGDDVLALSRNLGEVFGVFGTFEPKAEWWRVLGYDYLSNNSANFDGLRKLENLVKQIGPPKWPWALDVGLIRQGKAIFASTDPAVNCKGCHWPRPGTPRFFNDQTWATPIQDVGTDSREHAVMKWTAKSGVLTGAHVPFLQAPLKAEGELAFNILANAVLGSIIQSYVPPLFASLRTRAEKGAAVADMAKDFVLPPKLRELKGAFPTRPDGTRPEILRTESESFPYESRVLEGIWAAAPYLHNGSVPTLAELLKKPADRKARFKVGPNYDTTEVGLAADQTKFDFVLETTDCSARDSGNSRCGHDYGTNLSPQEKAALIEYLKTL